MAESLSAPSVDGTEAWITTPDGRLHARQWGGPVNDAAKPPIVLLHDSLGCVALWRDFPQRLAQSTPAQLEEWSATILTANSLDELFRN